MAEYQTEQLALLAMPRSCTHFTTLFLESFWKKNGKNPYIKFRTFRNFRSEDEQRAELHKAQSQTPSLLRITCPEETDNIEKIYGVNRFFSEKTTLVITPRVDFEDLLLARIIPYYHWAINRFDGLDVPKGYYSFCNAKGTWSPYNKKDIKSLIHYYKEHPLPFNEKKLNQVMNEVKVFFQWFFHLRSLVAKHPHSTFSTDDLFVSSDQETIEYGQNYPLLKFLNQLYKTNTKSITLNNMKQQHKEQKYDCFSEPQQVKEWLADFISSEQGQSAKALIYPHTSNP